MSRSHRFFAVHVRARKLVCRAGLLAAIGLAACVLSKASHAAQPTAEETAFFEKQVRPLLAASCYQCHGPKKQESGLRLDSRATMVHGGDRGPAIVPGAPDKSLVIEAVQQQGELKMPPKSKLKESDVAILSTWIKEERLGRAERP